MTTCIPFDNSYARLPERFFARIAPTPVASPRIVKVNADLAALLGIDPSTLEGAAGACVLGGNLVPTGAEPIATAYAGHQFGGFSPQLGDGRAILLGEVTGRDGARRDIQLKGAGPTPFSRGGDGRAGMGPVLREYIVSEAMAALGLPTTRALAAVSTGQPVVRETLLPGAVLTRVAASHIRVGTFQYFAARDDVDALRSLADYVIARHYPQCGEAGEQYRCLLARVVAAQAELVARWMLIGFIHGVMNTDNTSISGETIDYGPCAFMEAYDPATVFSAIDRQGRYAYGNQPRIAQWNLARLAEAMLPLLDADPDTAVAIAQEVLATFGPRFEAVYHGGLRRKIGLSTERPGDAELVEDLLQGMMAGAVDFTRGFGSLATGAAVPQLFADAEAADAWRARWRRRLDDEAGGADAARQVMRSVNPVYIPRNHMVQEALAAAMEREDFAPFEALLDVLAAPYTERPGLERYATPARPEQVVHRTFCGT